MDPAQVERVRRALRRRAKPSWRVLWRGRPAPRMSESDCLIVVDPAWTLLIAGGGC
jgi:hypothetical protein